MTSIPKQFQRRWGIFINNEIAAYINCPETYRKIATSLKNKSSKTHNINIVEEKK